MLRVVKQVLGCASMPSPGCGSVPPLG